MARQAVAGKPKRRRTQSERSAATRRKLIAAAFDCIYDLGFQEATLAKISRSAGVSRGSVQHQFGNRNDLILAVLDHFEQSVFALQAIPKTLSVAERADAAVDALWEALRGKEFLVVVQIWIGGRSDPSLHPTMNRNMTNVAGELDRRWHDLFADTSLSLEETAATWHLAFATLRGLAVFLMFDRGKSYVYDELQLLKKTIKSELTKRTPSALLQ